MKDTLDGTDRFEGSLTGLGRMVSADLRGEDWGQGINWMMPGGDGTVYEKLG